MYVYMLLLGSGLYAWLLYWILYISITSDAILSTYINLHAKEVKKYLETFIFILLVWVRQYLILKPTCWFLHVKLKWRHIVITYDTASFIRYQDRYDVTI